MTRRTLALLAAPVALAACSQERRDAPAADPEPRGSYAVDRATGETFARFEDDDGAVTTMRSGEQVPLLLPDGFSLYPGARVTNNTRVEKPEGILLSLDMTSPDMPGKIAAFYTAEAEAAGFAIEVKLDTGPSRVVAGKSPEGDTLALLAVREGEVTEAHLSIARGLR